LPVEEQPADESRDNRDQPHDFVNEAPAYADNNEQGRNYAESNIECVHDFNDKLKRRDIVLAFWDNGKSHEKKLLFQNADDMLFFHDERFYPGFFKNPIFLGGPRLLDNFNFVGLAEKELDRFLFHTDLKTSIVNA
jgi:hypothetical protein